MADEVSAGASYVSHSDLHCSSLLTIQILASQTQVIFSVLCKSSPEEETTKLQQSLSAFTTVVNRHQWLGVAVGSRSVAVVCKTLRTGVFLNFLTNKPTRSSWLCVTGWFFPRLCNLGGIFGGLRKQCFFNMSVNLVKFSDSPANQRL